MSHAERGGSQVEAPPALVRFSGGILQPDDLIEDLRRALA